MTHIFKNLEPRQEQADVVLFDELDEVNEIIFFQEGIFKIGYQLNNKSYYPLKFKNSQMFGAYDATYDYKSDYIYKTVCHSFGYFIRKHNWK